MTLLIALGALAAVALVIAVVRLAPAYLGAWAAVSAREREIAATGADQPRRSGRSPVPGATQGLRYWTGSGVAAASAEGSALPAGMTVDWIVEPSKETAGHGVARTSTGAFAHMAPATDRGSRHWSLATSLEALAGTAPDDVLGMALHRVGPMRRLGSARDGDCRGPRPSRDTLAA